MKIIKKIMKNIPISFLFNNLKLVNLKLVKI